MIDSNKAVFLSYASQDSEAAARMCEALRTAGIEVWFDQSELRGGDAWDASIRKQIKACALFVPIISANTHAREEGYFRLEWKLAVDRSHLMAGTKAFVVPVVIDDTRDDDERTPEKFRDVQWTRLPAGETPGAFCERVKILLGGSESITTRVQTGTNVAATGSPAKALKRWMIPAVGAALVVLIGGGWAWRNAHPSAVVASAAVPVPLPAASEKSVAVLPFVDMSEKHDQEYFSDGLTEELIDLLARTPELRVPARTSSYFFKGKQATVAEIAKALNVAHVLEGSVRKSGRVLRITVQLIHVQDDHHLWSETYDRNLKDIFKVQDEIAGSVARALKAVIVTGTLTGGSSVIGSEAYDLYLQGLASERRHSRVGFRSAINFYRSAVQIEPKYALAWAQLSELYGDDAGDTGATPAIAYARAREAANRALLLNPLLAEAHDAMGEIHKNYDWNWPAAKAEFRRALEVDPTNQAALLAYGSFARMMGLRNEAIRVFEQAVNRDPLNASAQVELGWADWVDGRLGEAESRYRKGLNLAPEAVALHAFLGLIMVESGQSERALSEIQREPDEGIRMYALAIASFAAGRKSESDRLLAEFTHKYGTLPGWQVSIAQIHAERGEFDDAFRWLGRGYEQRDAGVAGLLDYPFLRKLNGDPRYKELLHTLKLPDT